jgi:hypothetical protein
LERLAEDLYLLRGVPPYAINEYLAGEVLIDAGSGPRRSSGLEPVTVPATCPSGGNLTAR